MTKIWNYISYVGLKNSIKNPAYKSIILANQLNFIAFCIMLFLYACTSILSIINDQNTNPGTNRFFIVLLVSVLNFILSKYSFHRFVKINLIYLPVFIIFIFPTLCGFIEEESYFYYQYGIIAISIFPQLILTQKKEKPLLYVSFLYYLMLLLSSFHLLDLFSPEKMEASALIKSFYEYYVLSAVTIFVFIHLSIYYFRKANIALEKELTRSNEDLNASIENLKFTQQHLVQSEKMSALGTLTSGIAHEINNPLNFMYGGLSMLSDIKNELLRASSEEIVDRYNFAINSLHTGVERTSNIVNSLMTFSYKGTSKLITHDIHNIIDTTLLFMKKRIGKKILLTKTYLLNTQVPIYPDKFHQVLISIIENAIYELHKSEQVLKKLEIKTHSKSNFAYITISNNGPLIPADHVHQIFDPFFTTKEPGKGIGLGLSICFSLISEHSGELLAENRNNEVAFTIKLPLDKF